MAFGEGEYKNHSYEWDIIEWWDRQDHHHVNNPKDIDDMWDQATIRVTFDDGEVRYFDIISEYGWDEYELFSDVEGGIERGSGSKE